MGCAIERRLYAILSTLLFFSLILIWLSGCAPGKQTPEAILIGGTISETGVLAAGSGPFRKLMNAWADMVNESGGIYLKDYDKKIPIRFVIYDDASDQSKSEQLYQRLINDDKVHFLIGPYSSPMNVGATAVAERNQIPMICVEANSDAIYSRGFKWIVGVLASARSWSHLYLEMLKAKTDAKTIAFVVENSLHPKEVYEGAVARVEELGFTAVTEAQFLAPETKDFGSAIAKLKASNPDVVFVSARGETVTVGFTRALTEARLKLRALHVIHHGGHFLGSLGPAAELVTGESYWMPGMAGEGADDFKQLLKRSGLTVEEYPWTAIRMYAFQAIKSGLEKAGTLDREKLMEAFRKLDIMTIGGRLTFAGNGSGTMNPFPTQIQKGRYITVWPKQDAGGDYLYPRP